MPPAYPFPTPIPVIPNAYKVRIFGTTDGRPSGNELGLVTSGGGTAPTDHDIAAMIATHWATFATSQIATGYTGQSVGLYNLSTSGSPLVEVPMTAPGGQIGTILPIGVSALIKHDVGVRGKSGRTFISPITVINTDASNNNLSSGGKILVQAGWDAFINGVLADPVWGSVIAKHCVISTITNKLWDPRALPVVSSVVEAPLASQNRRRLR